MRFIPYFCNRWIGHFLLNLNVNRIKKIVLLTKKINNIASITNEGDLKKHYYCLLSYFPNRLKPNKHGKMTI